jgi:ribosomal protein L40E
VTVAGEAAVARRCRECGAAVPAGAGVCPRCRSADLVADASARSMGIDGYDRLQKRGRAALVATALTTLVTLVAAVGIGLAFQGIEPGATRGSSEGGLMALVRALGFLLVINPMVIAALGVVLGLLSYKVWYRLVTGERASTELSALDALAGKVTRWVG